MEELSNKIKQALADCAEGLYVIEEATKTVVYANPCITARLGEDFAAKPCYAYFCNQQAPCRFCPALIAGQGVYAWEFFHTESQSWLSIKNRLIEEDGVVYRVGNVNVIQEAMNLSRDAVGEIRSLRELIQWHEQRKYLLEWEASHDRMTRLFNRSRFMKDSRELFGGCRRIGGLFIDINNLKTANDTLGHSFGDLMIKKVAGILEARICETVRAYRMGGDEFFVVLLEAGPGEAEAFAGLFERELDELNKQSSPVCQVAIGTAYGCADQGVDELLRQADLRMYAHKQQMKGQSKKRP